MLPIVSKIQADSASERGYNKIKDEGFCLAVKMYNQCQKHTNG